MLFQHFCYTSYICSITVLLVFKPFSPVFLNSCFSYKRPVAIAMLRQRIQVHQFEQMGHPNLGEELAITGKVSEDSNRFKQSNPTPNLAFELEKKDDTARVCIVTTSVTSENRSRLILKDVLNCLRIFSAERCTGRNSSRRGQSLNHLERHSAKLAVKIV